MFLHVGADVVISLKRITAILDVKSCLDAESTRELLANIQKEKRVLDIAGGEPKSLVLTDTEAYLSPISSLTLLKRADFLSNHVLTDLGE
ncbi:MAG: extracellular matrix regulator RemB [Mycobacterium leprae]